MNQNIVVIFGTIDYGKKAFKDCFQMKSKIEFDDPKKIPASKLCKILLLFSEDGVGSSEFIIGLGGEVTIDVSSVTRKNCQMSIKVVFLQQLPFLLIKLAFKFLTSRDNFI